jgi:hypothetical protein
VEATKLAASAVPHHPVLSPRYRAESEPAVPSSIASNSSWKVCPGLHHHPDADSDQDAQDQIHESF